MAAVADQKDLVLKALENPNYTWRTIAGIAKETGLDEETVHQVLKALGEEVIRSEVPSEKGEGLYTTRSHYRKKTPWWKRFFAALRNRAT
jgi:hypothetical protein